ncbi:MAG: ABC transporter permease [Ruminococcaceae bacterium]|nr:ABC transporter permease [Oscillospiraceae bacterium]
MLKKTRKINFVTIFALVILTIVIAMVLFPALFTSYDPLKVDMTKKLLAPCGEHILGTDEYGRDIFCRIVYGARSSVCVGLGTAILSALIGVPLGLVAGYYGGKADNIIMRIMDAFQSFPSILLAILLSTIFDTSILSLILTISAVSFPRFAKLVRGNVLVIKKQDYVAAAKVAGVSNSYIMFNTILKNCMSVVVIQFSMLTATAILIEAGMSFLGLGLEPPAPAWGSMLFYANKYVNSSISYVLSPTFTIFLVVLSINLLGDALRDILDPKKKS